MVRKLVVNSYCVKCAYGETKTGTLIEIIGIKKEWKRLHGDHRESLFKRLKKIFRKKVKKI
jgi:hypothetical protein